MVGLMLLMVLEYNVQLYLVKVKLLNNSVANSWMTHDVVLVLVNFEDFRQDSSLPRNKYAILIDSERNLASLCDAQRQKKN